MWRTVQWHYRRGHKNIEATKNRNENKMQNALCLLHMIAGQSEAKKTCHYNGGDAIIEFTFWHCRKRFCLHFPFYFPSFLCRCRFPITKCALNFETTMRRDDGKMKEERQKCSKRIMSVSLAFSRTKKHKHTDMDTDTNISKQCEMQTINSIDNHHQCQAERFSKDVHFLRRTFSIVKYTTTVSFVAHAHSSQTSRSIAIAQQTEKKANDNLMKIEWKEGESVELTKKGERERERRNIGR